MSLGTPEQWELVEEPDEKSDLPEMEDAEIRSMAEHTERDAILILWEGKRVDIGKDERFRAVMYQGDEVIDEAGFSRSEEWMAIEESEFMMMAYPGQLLMTDLENELE